MLHLVMVGQRRLYRFVIDKIINLKLITAVLITMQCGARCCCRISPPRFLAESRKRRLNQGRFVSAVCLVVCLFIHIVFYVCIFVIYIKFLADRTATQYDRLLASSCCPSGCPSVCLSVTLCIVALMVGVQA